MAKVFEIARDMAEARDLAMRGFGYGTEEAARKALADPVIDPYYRSQLRVLEVEIEC